MLKDFDSEIWIYLRFVALRRFCVFNQGSIFSTVPDDVDSIFRDAKAKTDVNSKSGRPAEEIKRNVCAPTTSQWAGSGNVLPPAAHMASNLRGR